MKQITTVIPTQGRDSLLVAVDSAIQQSGVSNEVIVVVDGDDSLRGQIEDRLPDDVKVIATGKASNGNIARNLGVRHASNPYIAFLDDDDYWLTGKLKAQLDSAPAPEQNWIATCSLSTYGGQVGKVWPARPKKSDEDITEYLFNREQLKSRPKYLQVSTWVAPTHVFKKYPFDTGLKIHQDFDWIIRRVKQDEVALIQIPDVLCRYRINPSASISADSKWKDSKDWLLASNELFTKRSEAEFLLLVTQAFAVRDKSIISSLELISHAVLGGGKPGAVAVVIALARTIKAATIAAWSGASSKTQRTKGRPLRDK